MHRKQKIIALGGAALALVLAQPAQADEITLKNGDRISGKILRKDDASVVIQTSYAGDITIPWRELNGMITDSPLTFNLSDGTVVKGIAVASSPGTIRIKAGDILETAPVRLDNVAGISEGQEKAPPVKLHGVVTLAASIADGNTDKKNYHFDGEMVARTASNRFSLGGAYNQSEDDGEKSEENWLGYMKYDHFLTRKWYLYSHGLFAKDPFKDLNLRTTLGLGSGYQYWESEERNLSFEGGLSYVSEDYDIAEDASYPAGRWALRYDQFLLRSALQFYHNHELLFGLENFKDLIFRTQTGLRIPIVERLNAVLQVDTDYDNTPAPGNDRLDTYYRAGVGYTW